MTMSALLTSKDQKGIHLTGLFDAVVNKAGFDDTQAQRIIERGDELQSDIFTSLKRLSEVSKTIVLPPQGGMLHFVSVPVDESRPWDEVVRVAGPNTPNGYNVWKVGDQYPPQGESGIREIIFVNFGPGSFATSAQALAWGKENRLRPASPRGCFAIGEHCPTLNRELGMNYIVVVSLDPCSFGGSQQVCGVWWWGSERQAGLYWFDREFGDGYWFPFVRE